MAITLDGTVGVTSPDFIPSSSNIPTNGLFLPTTNALGFATNSTERLRLDASGNLGLGVTPSAWVSTFKAFQIGARGSVYAGSDASMRLAYNAFYDGTGYKRIAASSASQWIADIDGSFAWFQAGSSTAGSAITFTQAMTLDASGNLLLGTTTANAKAKFQLVSPGSLGTVVNVGTFGSSAVFSLGGVTNNNDGIYFGTGDTAGSNIAAGLGFLREATGWNSAIAFYTNNVTSGPNGISAMQEKARIDSSGNLLVGTTSIINTGAISLAVNGATSNGLTIKNTSATTTDFIEFFNNSASPTYAGYIRQTGSTTVSYVTSSDYRLKTNIKKMTGALEKVLQLNPVTYTWIEDQKEGQGFIAHELQEIVPECVCGEKDEVDEHGNPIYQGIDTSFLAATLTAAIQELTARLEALEAK